MMDAFEELETAATNFARAAHDAEEDLADGETVLYLRAQKTKAVHDVIMAAIDLNRQVRNIRAMLTE